MSTNFYRGQQLGRNDLNIYLVNAVNTPVNAAEISYALYDFTTGQEVLVGVPMRTPANPSVGEYFASIIVPLDANLGDYRIRWTFREIIGGAVQQVVQEFSVADKAGLSSNSASMITGGAINATAIEYDLMGRLRILLRDNCVGGEELIEVDLGGERVLISMEELWRAVKDADAPTTLRTHREPHLGVREAFSRGELKVLSVSPLGERAWKKVLNVTRAEVGHEEIIEVASDRGVAILTGGHRVFVTPVEKCDACLLLPGMSVEGGSIRGVRRVERRQYMFDLTAADWHNFFLVRSGLLVSNSPDRNYHFRPPAHEETVQQFSRVFGYIWEDVELQEYLNRSLDMIGASPPRTPFSSVDQLVMYRPEWRTLLLTGAMLFAIQAVRLNWVADEFSLVGDTLVTVLVDDECVPVTLMELYGVLEAC